MVSRRVLLFAGTGAAAVVAVGGAAATDTLDDAIRAVGVDPKPEPDPGDRRLAQQARADADTLVRLAAAAEAPAEVTAVLRQQAAALPGPGSQTSALTGDLAQACLAAADDRATDAGKAVSVDLAQVLASMSAGLDQCRSTLRNA